MFCWHPTTYTYYVVHCGKTPSSIPSVWHDHGIKLMTHIRRFWTEYVTSRSIEPLWAWTVSKEKKRLCTISYLAG